MVSSEPAYSHGTMERGEHAIPGVGGWENLPKEVIPPVVKVGTVVTLTATGPPSLSSWGMSQVPGHALWALHTDWQWNPHITIGCGFQNDPYFAKKESRGSAAWFKSSGVSAWTQGLCLELGPVTLSQTTSPFQECKAFCDSASGLLTA